MVEILNRNSREFKGIATVEVLDGEGEIVPVSQVLEFMPDWMKMGAPITEEHGGKQIGRGLNYSQVEVDGKPAIEIHAEIFNFDKYPLIDKVWEEVKKGERRSLSIGGQRAPEKGPDGKVNFNAGLYEITLCKIPQNPKGVLTAISLAKSKDNDYAKNTYKGFAGFEGFDDCVSKMKAKGKPEESAKKICGALQRDLEKTNENFMKNFSIEGEIMEDVKKQEEVEPVKEETTDSMSKVLEALNEIKAAIVDINQTIKTKPQEEPATESEVEKEDSAKKEPEPKETEVSPEKKPEDLADENQKETKKEDEEKKEEDMKKSVEELKKEIAELKKSKTIPVTGRPGATDLNKAMSTSERVKLSDIALGKVNIR